MFFFIKSKSLKDDYQVSPWKGSELRSPYGLPPFTAFHGVGCRWRVSDKDCAFIIVVDGNL